MMAYQRCIKCGSEYGIDEIVYFCKKCGDILEIKFEQGELAEALKDNKWRNVPLSVWRYRHFMPISDSTKIVSLNEGGTGFHLCERLAKHLGLRQLYVKNEGENPTGSFKDRGMTVGVTKAVELGVQSVICASTGNTSASLAANSINPFRIEGQKSLGYEICDQLKQEAPDRIIVPVGNAGNISAIWKGFTEFHELGVVKALPKMTGIQAAGSAPIAKAIKDGSDTIVPVSAPETVATAIRIGAPVSWKKALNAIRESGGTAETVTDDEILSAQKMLARVEGLFVEPASASSIAGLIKLVENGVIDKDERVVCVTTGHGLKDPDTAVKMSEKPVEVDVEISAIEEALGLKEQVAILAR
jgi:threonine synthase